MTLEALGTDYVDLYLMHWPAAFKRYEKGPDGKPVIDYELTADPYPTWQAMEALVDKGKARNIGISKYVCHVYTFSDRSEVLAIGFLTCFL